MARADFNGDGRDDVALAMPYADVPKIGILAGNGSGGLDPPVFVNVPQAPLDLIADDFNGDGRPDLAVVATGESVYVLHNGGGTSFAAPLTLLAGDDPMRIASGDLNGDAKPDIVVTNYNRIDFADGNYDANHDVSVFFNLGNATFSSPLKLAADSGTHGLVLADVNGDARLDIVVTNEESGTLSVFVHTGGNAFAAAMRLSTGGRPTRVVAGDFDGNGTADLIANDRTNRTLKQFVNLGGSGFSAPRIIQSATIVDNMKVADVDADHRLDLIAVGGRFGASNDAAVTVFSNAGNGILSVSNNYAVGSFGVGLLLHDFNDDLNIDILVPQVNTREVSLLTNRGNGTFHGIHYLDALVSSRTDVNNPRPAPLAVADFDSDGDLDVAAPDESGGLKLLTNKGQWRFETVGSFAAGSYYDTIMPTDLDGDGNLDWLLSHRQGDAFAVVANDGQGGFRNPVIYRLAQTDFYAVLPAFFNSDETVDMLVMNDQTISSITNLGLAPPYQHRIPLSKNQHFDGVDFGGVLTVGDLSGRTWHDKNGNGRLDAGEPALPGRTVYIDLNDNGQLDANEPRTMTNDQGRYAFRGIESGPYRISELTPSGWGQTWPGGVSLDTFPGPPAYLAQRTLGAPLAGDFDRDGDLDVAAPTWDEYATILLNNGQGRFATTFEFFTGGYVDNWVSTDVDGDHAPDFVGLRKNWEVDPPEFAVVIVLNQGPLQFSDPIVLPLSDIPNRVAAGDVTGDGRPDLLVSTLSDLVLLQRLSNGTYGAPRTLLTGESFGPVMLVDLNGDTHLDLIAVTSYSGKTLLLQNDGFGDFATTHELAAGDWTSTLVSGDFDGDGNLDLALNQSSSHVQILHGAGDGAFVLRPLLATKHQHRSLQPFWTLTTTMIWIWCWMAKRWLTTGN